MEIELSSAIIPEHLHHLSDAGPLEDAPVQEGRSETGKAVSCRALVNTSTCAPMVAMASRPMPFSPASGGSSCRGRPWCLRRIELALRADRRPAACEVLASHAYAVVAKDEESIRAVDVDLHAARVPAACAVNPCRQRLGLALARFSPSARSTTEWLRILPLPEAVQHEERSSSGDTAFSSTAPQLSSAARPLSVRRYLWRGLLGLAGCVIARSPSASIRPSRRSKLRVLPA